MILNLQNNILKVKPVVMDRKQITLHVLHNTTLFTYSSLAYLDYSSCLVQWCVMNTSVESISLYISIQFTIVQLCKETLKKTQQTPLEQKAGKRTNSL